MGDEATNETAQRGTLYGRPRRHAGRRLLRRHGRGRVAATLAVALVGIVALTGAGMIGAALTDPSSQPPPQPPAAAAPATVAQPAPGASSRTGLPASAPTTISITRIGVRANILALGVRDDGTVDVPPLDQAMDAGWYKLGVSPGEVGNAVIMGHVDSVKIGPAVFFRLGELLPGDMIQVTRADRSEVSFRVDGVRSYPKDAFPTELVYGPSDTASLRVITCGGIFNEQAGSYPDNVIVFATLVGSRQT
ncbi:class F sortase [Micromonospora endolithica]|uniref:Class F sortase n=1 Tax=Micromonospora endolithica TaxID=230091 RepID=A0A3A9ZQ66_9ACTN|nr:class F sortase [Micromonospora endolithica]RKN50372.1 class F sortase [Micromonospora endolithica]TWJ20954.1 sortase family protein [Micromonospora endolithica]